MRLIYRVFVADSVSWHLFVQAFQTKFFGTKVLLAQALAAIRLWYVRKNQATLAQPLVVNLGVDEFQTLLVPGAENGRVAILSAKSLPSLLTTFV